MEKKDINMLRPRRLHGWAENNEEIDQTPKRSFLFFLIPGILLLLVLGSYSLARSHSMANWSDNPSDYNPITLQPKKRGIISSITNYIFKSDKVMDGQKEDRINILMMGIGGSNHDGGYLSDTNIIISIKPSTNEVAMISIPRDMSAKIEGYGWYKINHAHAYGEMKESGYGGEFARKTFSENLNIELPYYATVDFKAFEDIIDAVGGVTVNVPRSFVDYSYPGPNFSYQTISFKKGEEQMDGKRALIFARSRHGNNGEGSDFSRAYRQQLVIAALKEKMLSAGTYLNPVKIKKILDSISSHIATNLDFSQLMYLAGAVRDIDKDNIKTLVLDNSPSGYLRTMIGEDGAFLLAPKTGDYAQISSVINNVFNPNQSSSTPIYSINISDQTDLPFPNAKIEIQNGTWQSGLAARAKQDLDQQGFAIFTIGNSSYRPVVSSTLHILNEYIDRGFVEALERATGLNATTSMPVWIATSTIISSSTVDIVMATTTTSSTLSKNIQNYENGTDILLILGNDYN